MNQVYIDENGKKSTEIDAFLKAIPTYGSIKEKILAMIDQYGSVTADEFAERTGILIHTTRNVMAKLQSSGKVAPTLDVRINKNGNECVVYVAGSGRTSEQVLVEAKRAKKRYLDAKEKFDDLVNELNNMDPEKARIVGGLE